MGERRGVYRVVLGKPEGKRPFGNPVLNGRILLNWIFKKWDARHGLDCSDSEWGQVAGTCEGNNEPSGSTKCWEFLD